MSVQLGGILEGFKLLKRLGAGSFGETYYAEDMKTSEKFAIKIENIESHKKILLSNERAILEDLKGCRYAPAFFAAEVRQKYAFMAMDCLGPSLSKVMGVFGDLSLKTALRVGLHMLLALRELHTHGYLHRDVKPSNFLVVPNRRTVVKVVDFGLSRKFIDENGDFIRVNNGFVGSLKYASIYAHQRQEITQRDDLLSWFYSLIELIRGKLPWSRVSSEKHILRIKQNITVAKLCEKCPKQFKSIYAYLRGLQEFETPNYYLIASFLLDAMHDHSVKWEDPYDWDYLTKKELHGMTAISLAPVKGDLPDHPDLPKTMPAPVLPEKYNNLHEEVHQTFDGGCFRCSIC
ncbi:Casein kinase I [Tritrichomonas foetus]|uniref:non-specific serine/threonine protein kinase n=1 Tax=Tritrichomonas foetus TaxID=1144522 RepID=A0A1J4KQX9_9EUKA|nr:Casein kinase I [Tritrichomonas foetus]|eukprot:OHT11877.1 Casein kinase I [Tritrichomonas foetus]